ncbi:hypothetical protein SeMB42_g05550 [Synchytrium endobioticum]|uniref:Large ribosomal subunit protein uL6 alpha-beta domain-containing protein n=1 Tax=Synchytrium endobioticum TaxID=286115 RepID=A0A507CQR2_9FUNG|nr:hypothetical protein SeMB42_g05550 [Synchytrium endobioticum]
MAFKYFHSSSSVHSTLGRKIIKYSPSDVSITIEPRIPDKSFPTCHQQVMVKGPLGSNSVALHDFIDVNVDFVAKTSPRTKDVAHDTMQTTLQQKKSLQVTVRDPKDQGVTDGYTLPIRIVGVGYRAALENDQLVLRVGYANPVIFPIPTGSIKVTVPAPQRILLQGHSLEHVTQFAAKIRRSRPPEPYNQKGIFVGDETIKKKEGKKR